VSYDVLSTVASLKAWLKPQGVNDDAEFGVLLQVASDLIGRYLTRDNLGAVYPYTENYFRNSSFQALRQRSIFDLVLRHWPIVSLTSVTINNSPVTILNQTGLQQAQAGVFVLEDVEPRILKFQYLNAVYPITVVYTAGYAAGSIPMGLQQACNQYAAEIFRSANWVSLKSQAMAGETTAFDTGGAVGMSDRVKAMLIQYKDVVPFRGFG
jgi:hypothetical protein